MQTADYLSRELKRLDGKGYRAYRDIQSEFRINEVTLTIDHVQSDPYAPPSRMRVTLQRSGLKMPEIRSPLEQTALEDFLARRFRSALKTADDRSGGSDSADRIFIDSGGQEVLERTACRITHEAIEFRVSAGLPARGRSILGAQADNLLTRRLPELARTATRLDETALLEGRRFLDTVTDADALRNQLSERGLVAFIGDDAHLPRASGVSDHPARGTIVPFRSPESLEITLERPNSGPIRGIGIPEGVTLIVGGGFHGKSTLLNAIARGVYNHVPGDGREYVVCRDDAVKIRAEDGRAIAGVDLRPFINRLPLGGATDCFTSENASGSTSQAANILEAMESGSQLLLMDEDTCATNFMIRDEIMRRLVPDESEPITPFIDRVRQLHEQAGVSTILVMGGSGDFFSVADTVIWMDEYVPHDVSTRARDLIDRRFASPDTELSFTRRIPEPDSIDPTRGKRTKTRARGTEEIGFGSEQIDVGQVEQIVDASQTRGIAQILVYAKKSGIIDGSRSVSEILDEIDSVLERNSIDSVSDFRGHLGDLVRPRRYEIGAALNRLRSLKIRQTTSG
jgi:predicted ABC-class ATPase